jgi:NAD kinase
VTAPAARPTGERTGERQRVVLITRKTSLELLLERHGTLSQARFYLRARGEDPQRYEVAHEHQRAALSAVSQALPPDQRRTRVEREQLARFLFAADDLVLIVGQDGLVANVAKYLQGQTTVGINPDPASFDGVLCRHPPAAMPQLLAWAREPGPTFRLQERTMAMARREDGQQLLALNELFVGHQTHQSARYRIELPKGKERQSSSGLICSTGTGATGWGRSIAEQRHLEKKLPAPDELRLVWFVREPFPSVATGTKLSFGQLAAGQALVLWSEMQQGGTVFADGIEEDRLEFATGHRLEVRVAERQLRLVVPG